MRRTAAILCMIGVLAFSVAAGWLAADWPSVCRRLQWCDQDFPR